MKKNLLSLGLAMVMVLGLAAFEAQAQGAPLGTLQVAGPVLIDGRPVSGTPTVSETVRMATGDGGNALLNLASGGEIRLAGQSDVVVTEEGNQLRVQLLCGEVALNTTRPVLLLSAYGARVATTTGRATIAAGDRPIEVREGRTRDIGGPVSVTTVGGTALVVTSTFQCQCDCVSPQRRP